MALWSLLKNAWTWLSGGPVIWLAAGSATLILLLFGLWRFESYRLDAEKAAHAVTVLESSAWKALAEKRLDDALAQQAALAACLKRETEATKAVSERAAIMKQALPRARAPEEKVVDDETRAAAVARLNRDW